MLQDAQRVLPGNRSGPQRPLTSAARRAKFRIIVMAIEVRMAKLSPTMETGTINRWVKKEGDKVAAGDALAEVETDKASMPLETFDDGVLLKIVAKEGATAKIDELLAVIGKPGEDIAPILARSGASQQSAPAAAEAPKAKSTAVMPAVSAKQAAPAPEPALAAAPAPRAPVSHENFPSSNGGRVKASPLAKKLARERGVDLTQLAASGPGGRIVVRDVPESSAAAARPAPIATPTGAGEDIPVSNLRQTIAKRLLLSKQTIPHFYLYAEVSMDRAVSFREDLNAAIEEGGVKISFNDLVIKVAAAA